MKVKIDASSYTEKRVPKTGRKALFLDKDTYYSFDETVLGLGDIASHSITAEAICGMFDLAGFTTFSSQVDPHLAVPQFMAAYLSWLFGQVRAMSTVRKMKGGFAMYTRLPFFAKFLGDGVMFLWDAAAMTDEVAVNVPLALWNVCVAYEEEFLPQIHSKLAEAPSSLRVGVARGRVFSVGDDEVDYVGPCINLAARLQKLAGDALFCCSRRGFNLDCLPKAERDQLLVREANVRGIGQHERVLLKVDGWALMNAADKQMFTAL